MKKKLRSIIALIFIVICAGYGAYNLQNDMMPSALALANIEALARYELPEVDITCGSESGSCWRMYGDCYVSWVIRYEDCTFTGFTYDSCVTPCD